MKPIGTPRQWTYANELSKSVGYKNGIGQFISKHFNIPEFKNKQREIKFMTKMIIELKTLIV